ncbi:hypothetical protein BOX15_Mlig028920g1, partial [Macrostomum lignano]
LLSLAVIVPLWFSINPEARTMGDWPPKCEPGRYPDMSTHDCKLCPTLDRCRSNPTVRHECRRTFVRKYCKFTLDELQPRMAGNIEASVEPAEAAANKPIGSTAKPSGSIDKSASTADKSAETADKSAGTADKSAGTADKSAIPLYAKILIGLMVPIVILLTAILIAILVFYYQWWKNNKQKQKFQQKLKQASSLSTNSLQRSSGNRKRTPSSTSELPKNELDNLMPSDDNQRNGGDESSNMLSSNDLQRNGGDESSNIKLQLDSDEIMLSTEV